MKQLFTLIAAFFISAHSMLAQWQLSNAGNSSVWSITKKDSTIMATGGGGVYFSEDFGQSWTLKACPGSSRNIIVRDTAIFIAGAGGIYRSSDHGTTWTSVANGIGNPSQIWSLSATDSSLVLGTSGSFGGDTASIYISADHGTSWTKALSLGIFDVFYSFAVKNNEVVAGVLPSGVFYSSDYGANWVLKPALLSAKYVGWADTNILCAITGGSGGIYLSSNTGITWSNVLPLYYGYSFAHGGGFTFAGTTNGFYYSADNGYTWTNNNTGLPPTTTVNSICVADPYVFIGTTNSEIYRRDISDFVATTEVHSISAARISVSPNPFFERITIHGTTQKGTVKILDLFGKIHVWQQAAESETVISTGNLSDGFYFVEYSHRTLRLLFKMEKH